MHKSKLTKEHQKRYHAQQEAVDKARKILDKAGVKWIFATDEDVLTALEGDDRLPLVWKEGGFDLIEEINEQVMDNMMNYWGDCLSYGIDETIGTDGETEVE
jgi:hypothetical protein